MNLSPHEKALELLKSKGKATPKEIEAYVGLGPYASKYICYLKLRGYEIETVKNGRSVAEYKFISDGDSATRDYKWVPPAKRGTAAVKAAKVKVAKAAAPVKKASGKKVAVKAAAVKAPKKEKPIMDKITDPVEREFGSSGNVGNFSVDNDWDSMDGIDVNNFLK
jgi:hypothetical protein